MKGFGGVDQLELVELPDPQPQPGQVRIRVEASGLNYADVMQREGLYPGGPKPPFIPGLEAAGVVEEGELVARRNSCDGDVRQVVVTLIACVCSAAACIPFPRFDVVCRGGCVSGSVPDGISRAHDLWASNCGRERVDSCSGRRRRHCRSADRETTRIARDSHSFFGGETKTCSRSRC